jgi:hypothetical protein
MVVNLVNLSLTNDSQTIARQTIRQIINYNY